MKGRFFLAAACVSLGVYRSSAQSFAPTPAIPADIEALREFVRVEQGRVFRTDWEAFSRDLAAVPAEGALAPAIISLPMPRGHTERFRIVESPIMEPDLAAAFPGFKTYRVWGIDDASAVGRFDITSQGLRAMIRTSAGAVFIDPYSAQQRDYVSVYYLHEMRGRDGDWACHVGPAEGADRPLPVPAERADAPNTGSRGAVPLRTYRLAMACTGEFGAYQSEVQGHAPNTADAMAAIVTIANRTNVAFEADLGVRLVLVANNHLLAFIDPATDPYPTPDPECTTDTGADCSSPYLNINGSVINSRIGVSNYDVGHVLTRVRGGVAYLRSVCGSNKAGGVSGIPRGGDVDPVSALVVLHELGHQFGANHTFNGVLGRCNANINGTTNWEPGGGSTLLAYPGACPMGGPYGEGDTDNLVQFADPYFHTGSLMEIRQFLAGPSSQCFQNAASGNLQAPVIASLSPSGLWIPPSTPFELTVVATDDSANLTYCWEQLDIGPAQRLTGPTSADNGFSALFRSFPPSEVGTRVFPRMSDLLAGTSYIGERMPTFTQVNRKFRVTVRDNQGASVTSSEVRVRIASTQPFVVNEPATNQVVRDSQVLVRWNAEAISGDPVNTQSVRIALSIDGGQTFPIVLSETAANTGEALLSTQGQLSEQARIKVSANGNSFFNLSGQFRLRQTCGPDFDGDGFVNGLDFDLFVYAFQDGLSATDYDGDGFVTGLDFDAFVYAFEAGC